MSLRKGPVLLRQSSRAFVKRARFSGLLQLTRVSFGAGFGGGGGVIVAVVADGVAALTFLPRVFVALGGRPRFFAGKAASRSSVTGEKKLQILPLPVFLASATVTGAFLQPFGGIATATRSHSWYILLLYLPLFVICNNTIYIYISINHYLINYVHYISMAIGGTHFLLSSSIS
jgi:hypothetical protein